MTKYVRNLVSRRQELAVKLLEVWATVAQLVLAPVQDQMKEIRGHLRDLRWPFTTAEMTLRRRIFPKRYWCRADDNVGRALRADMDNPHSVEVGEDEILLAFKADDWGSSGYLEEDIVLLQEDGSVIHDKRVDDMFPLISRSFSGGNTTHHSWYRRVRLDQFPVVVRRRWDDSQREDREELILLDWLGEDFGVREIGRRTIE